MQSARGYQPPQARVPPAGVRRSSEPVHNPNDALLQLGGNRGPLDQLDGLGDRAFSAETALSNAQGAQLAALQDKSPLGDRTVSAPGGAQFNTTGTIAHKFA